MNYKFHSSSVTFTIEWQTVMADVIIIFFASFPLRMRNKRLSSIYKIKTTSACWPNFVTLSWWNKEIRLDFSSHVLFFQLLQDSHCVWKLIMHISPTRCTILFSIFISLLYMFRASMFPSSGKNYCMYATLVFVTLYGWRLVCWLGFQSNQQTRRHPYRVTNTSVAYIQ